MRLKIVAKNMSTSRRPFVVVAYDRQELRLRRKLVEVTRLESAGGDPGQTITIDIEWSWSIPPQQFVWKAPPEHSLAWQLIEFAVDGRPLLIKAGMLA